MKKYIFDFIYSISIIIALVILFTSTSFSQNQLSMPSQIIKLTWQPSIEPDVWQYAIFYVQGADTSLFPFKTGTNPDSLWMGQPISNWSFATVHSLKYFHEPSNMQGTTYLRLGVSPINAAGKLGLIKCIPKVIRIKRPASITGIKTQ